MPTRAYYLLNTSEVPNLITLSYHTQIQDYLKGNVCLKEYCKRKRFCDSLDTKLTQTSITLRGMEPHTMKPQQGLERNSATGKKHLHNQSYIQILPILLKSVIWSSLQPLQNISVFSTLRIASHEFLHKNHFSIEHAGGEHM